MVKRKSEDDDFGLHKDTILDLYQGQKKRLPEVIAEMKQHYGFNRSPNQYRDAFRTWGVTKNITKSEWECILPHLRERESLEKRSIVEVRGTVVCAEKIRKQRKLHEFQTTYEKYHSRIHTVKRPKLPAYVRVFTPEPSPTLLLEPGKNIGIHPTVASYEHPGPSMREPRNCRTSDHCASVTPWQAFVSFMTSAVGVDINTFPTAASLKNMPVAAGSMSTGTTVISCGFQRLIDDILFAQYLTVGPGLLSMYENPYPYLPYRHLCTGIDMKNISHYTDSRSKLELLKLTVYGISNNFDTKQISSAIMDLAQEQQNLSLLEVLLGQKMLTTQAFAEKLFMTALQHDNLPLLQVIVASNAIQDLTRFARERWHFKRLGDALEVGEVARFHELLAQGEAVQQTQDVPKAAHTQDEAKMQKWSRISFQPSTLCREDNLNWVVCLGDYVNLEAVLRNMSRHDCLHLHPAVDTLRLAILQGRLDLAELLISFYPNLLNKARMEPWLLLEAAALYGDIGVFERLVAMGLDPCATDERNSGSPLAAACLNHKLPLVRHLLRVGLDVNGRCHGDISYSTFERAYQPLLEVNLDGLEDIKGLASLHVAVLCENVELILLLLSYGADAKKCCRIDSARLNSQLGCHTMGFWYDRSHIEDWICDDFRHIEVSALQLASRIDITLAGLLASGGVNLASPTPPTHSGMFFSGCRFLPSYLALASQQGCALELENQSAASTASSVFGTEETSELGLTSLLSGLEFSKPARSISADSTKRLTFSDHELKKMLLQAMAQAPDPEKLLDERKHYIHAICDEAARSGNLGVIQTVFQDGLFLNDGDLQHRIRISTLIQALQAKCSGTVTGLIDLGTDPNTVINCSFKRSGLTDALQFSVLQNDVSLVKLLIAKGANVNTSPAPEAGATALQFAARNGNFEILEILLAAGAELNAPLSYHHGMSAIEGAAAQGRLDMVRYLLECGADMRGKSNSNYRRTVYRSWKEGHLVLTGMIQDWKRKTYGPEDVEPVDVIAKTLEENELKFSDFEAMSMHARYGVSGDIYDLLLVGTGGWIEATELVDGTERSVDMSRL